LSPRILEHLVEAGTPVAALGTADTGITTVRTASGAIMQKRAAIYVRVSTDKQTVENQVTALRQIAERRGWEVVEQYRAKKHH
jgi:hypothetical protein